MEAHKFGGDWTVTKLDALRRYLEAYSTIFATGNASHFKTIYVDAFAGTGSIIPSSIGKSEPSILADDVDVANFLKGSTRIALETEPSFDKFIFIERSPDKASELEKLKLAYPTKSIDIIQSDANKAIISLCNNSTLWRDHRAVMFLDPYGMQVDWSTLQSIANTKAIDLWLLFPLGQAVMRLLTKNEMPPQYWQDALTRVFGTESWKETFYREEEDLGLFENEMKTTKIATFKSITRFLQSRLNEAFAGVADNPKPLVNSTGNPIYLLCFAAANVKGAPIAKKIAQHILKII